MEGFGIGFIQIPFGWDWSKRGPGPYLANETKGEVSGRRPEIVLPGKET